MDGMKILKEYFRLTDVMYQALKVQKYSLFEKTLAQRGELVKSLEGIEGIFSALSPAEKKTWRDKISDMESSITVEVRKYQAELEKEISKVNASQAKLRKHSKIKGYYGPNLGGQGNFINKLK